MEKLFQPKPAAERRNSASGPCIALLSSPAGASARPGLAVPSCAVAGAISKSFQEVSGPPHPASCLGVVLPAAAPPPLSACPHVALPSHPRASFVWLRRSGLRRVELSPWLLARFGAARLAAVAKRPEP